MPSIDERVVSMAFENQIFEQRVSQTLTTLTKLDTAIKNIGGSSGFSKLEADSHKATFSAPMAALEKLKSRLGFGEAKAAFSELDAASDRVTFSGVTQAAQKVNSQLAFPEAKKAFAEIDAASQQVSFGGLHHAIDSVTAKFSVLQGAAAVALGGITAQFAAQGAAIVKKFTLGPAIEGFRDYELKVGAVQTIMSSTGEKIGPVNKQFKEMDTYADRTIYSLRDMTGNIGKFTNAGVKLPIAVDAMKGIANVAALSGASAQEASRSMYNLGQAIGSGTVRLMDWRSVELANMGTKEFKQELINSALAMGKLEKGTDGVVRTAKGTEVTFKNFGVTLQDQWLTAEALTKTLNKYSDETTALGKKAYAAATDVKTFSMMLETLSAAAGTGWTDTFEIILGTLPEATKLWTGITNVIGGFIGKTADARNELLETWKELGGRKDLFEGIKNVFNAIFGILKPIGQAFRDIFPRKTGEDLAEMSENFRKFTERLMPTAEQIDGIKRTARGFFAVLHIGWEIIKGVIGVLGDLLGVVGKGSGGFLNFTGGIGDFLVAVDNALTKGGLLKGFFEGLSGVLKTPLELLGKLATAVASLFGGEDDTTLVQRHSELLRFGKVLTPMERLVLRIKDAWDKLVGAFERTKAAVEPFFSSFVDKLRGFGDLISDALSGLNFENIMSGVQAGATGGIFLVLKKALGGEGIGGLMESVKGTLGGVNQLIGGFTGQMEAMQSKLKAQALLAIAGAIAVLAAGLFILSTIDGDDLSKAMTAVAIGLGELMGAMKLMTAGLGKKGILMLPFIAVSMIGLAIAVTILAAAVKIFSTMNWEELATGLAGVLGSLTAIAAVMPFMPANLPITAAGLILVGVALNAIAAAVKIFASMSWEDLGKGLFGVAEALAMVVGAVILIPPHIGLTGAGLILVSAGLIVLAGAVAAFGNLDFKVLVQGIGGIAVALVALMAAILPMALLGPMVGIAAAGLILASVGLTILATAIGAMGNLKVETLVKGILGLGAALAVLSTGLILMAAGLPGAAALLVSAAALAVLGPAIGFIGQLDLWTIVKGLGALAVAMGIIAVGGLLMAPAVIALGIALVPLGLGFMLVAKAASIFASAVALLSDEGQKGFAVLLAAITGFVALIPTLLLSFIKGLVDIVGEVAKIAPKVVEALSMILETIITFLLENAGRLAVAIGLLVDAILTVLVENVPKIVAAGVKLLGALLSGISQNISQVTTKVAEIITKFLNALAAKAPGLITAGAKVLISFLQGITQKIPLVVATVTNMVLKFIAALTANVPKIIFAGQSMMLKFIGAIANFVPRLVAKGAEIILKFLDGLGNNVPKIVDKGAELIIKLIQGITRNINKIADKGADAVIKFLNGLAETIRTKGPELIRAGLNIADALIDGITEGFGLKGGLIKKALEKVMDLLPGWAKDALGIRSPSTVFMEIGKFTMQGFAKGVDDNAHGPKKAIGNSAIGMINEIKRILGVHSPSQVMKDIGKEVGTGFAQGIHGSVSDIRGAFASLKERINTDIKTINDAIKEDRNQWKELAKNPQENAKELDNLREAFKKNYAELDRLKAARSQLTNGLLNEKQSLIRLTKEYEKTAKKLEKAQAALDEATRARNDAQRQYTDQYNVTPDIDKLMSDALADAELTEQQRQEKIDKIREEAEKRRQINQVANYKKALQAQIEATKKYNETLTKLRALGLDDETYKKLLAKGIEGQEFADQLLRAGKPAIDEINKLDAQLLSNAANLAKEAAANLYQAGVDAAQGLVNGLKAKKAQLADSMDDLADMMVRSIKRKLKIRSPSEVFAEVGKFISQGLARGLDASDASAAAAQMGKDTLSAISSAIGDSVEVDPTITPVLDLTQVQREAKKLDNLTNVTPITAAASFGQAAVISTEKQALDTATAEVQTAQAGNTFKFEQNNYSPESLSDVEIYRQTKNQLGQIKSALGLVS